MNLSTSVESEYLCMKLREGFGLEAAQVNMAMSGIRKALLQHPLSACAGEGEPASGADDERVRGTAWIPTQPVKIWHLFNLGVFIPWQTAQFYEKALQQRPTVTRLETRGDP